MAKIKCPDCGGTDLREQTEWNRANCHMQFLIDRDLFCYDCESEAIKHRLDNPIISCDDCEGTPICPMSEAAENARRQNDRYITQNDPRDDWPHAIPMLREAA